MKYCMDHNMSGSSREKQDHKSSRGLDLRTVGGRRISACATSKTYKIRRFCGIFFHLFLLEAVQTENRLWVFPCNISSLSCEMFLPWTEHAFHMWCKLPLYQSRGVYTMTLFLWSQISLPAFSVDRKLSQNEEVFCLQQKKGLLDATHWT